MVNDPEAIETKTTKPKLNLSSTSIREALSHYSDYDLLRVTGAGIISGNGFDPTAGNWSFRVQNSGGEPKTIFSFSAKTAAAAPDGGSAIALLGIALTGIEGLCRKLRRAT